MSAASSKTPLRIAVIGKGRWGSRIVETLQTLSECQVVAVVSHEWQKLVEIKIDGVVVATPASTHFAIALPFVKRGGSVFIEKPFTTSLSDAQQLADEATKSGAMITVGHLHLYNPAYLAMKQGLAGIGAIQKIVAEAGGPGPIRTDVSVLWDWMPHDIALILDLVGTLPISVQASASNGTASASLTFGSGASASISNSWILKEKCRRLTVIGEKGQLVFDDFAPKDPASERPLTVELRAWLESIVDKKPLPSDMKEGLAVMKVLEAVAQAASSQKDANE